RDGGLVTMVAGPERMAILDAVQATMAVIEGHAEHVMDAVGEDVLPSLPELRAALDRRRREKPLAVKLLERLIGLELKMRQYELGREFCDAVVERGGIEALNRVWASPAQLPTLAELEAPEAWLARTAARAA
ncbi:MAG TPA: zinc-dependent metalloprotease, partial [Solirubrobacteraceae bacterium]|nr:zinc-dependent metalloprotease [Solirubrobacteraceae bacterium]